MEHRCWEDGGPAQISLDLVPGVDPPPSSPESREFVILIFEAHSPPIRYRNDVELDYLIPVYGSSFSCEIGECVSELIPGTTGRILI